MHDVVDTHRKSGHRCKQAGSGNRFASVWSLNGAKINQTMKINMHVGVKEDTSSSSSKSGSQSSTRKLLNNTPLSRSISFSKLASLHLIRFRA